MNIVFLRSNPVNPDSRVEKEVNTLLKNKYSITIIAWDRSSKYNMQKDYLHLKNGSATIIRFGIPATFGGGFKENLLPLIRFQTRIFYWLYKNKNTYDVIHACDFDTAFIASKIAKLNNKKLVYDIFDYYVDSFNVPKKIKGVIEILDRRIINSAYATIICTEKRIAQIKGSLPNELVVIHNTPEEIDIRITKPISAKTKIKIVYVGILSKTRFLKEISEVIIKNPEFEFHVGGFGLLESYFKDISKMHPNIYFYGKLPYEQTLELENKCDVIVALYDPIVPNHFYAAPNKFYEALMLGKPLIMVKKTGMAEVVEKNGFGEVIEYNKESFEKSLKKLEAKQWDWSTMGINMKNMYKTTYSWNEMEMRLLNLYQKISED